MNDFQSNIVVYLLKKFVSDEIKNTILLVILTLAMNILYVNVISRITASIINAAQNLEIVNIYNYFKYFIIVSVVYLVIYYVYKSIQSRLISKLRQWIKLELIKIVLTINNNDLSQINMTEINIPINRIAAACFLMYNSFITHIFPNMMLLLVIFGYFAYKNLNYGIIFLICNIIIIFTIYLRYYIIRESNILYENAILKDESHMLEILNNFDRIIQRGNYEFEQKNYSLDITNTIDASINFYLKANKEGLYVIILMNFTIFLNIGYLIYLFINKDIDIQLFITFFTIMLIYREKLFTVIQHIPDYAEFMGRGYMIMNYFKDFIKVYTNILNSKKNKVKLVFDDIIFENVSFEYNKNKDQTFNKSVLQNFNLHIKLNGLVGITGPSGKGKSTIGKLIIKLYKYSGKITIDGTDIDEIDNVFLRNNIIYIDQSSKFFDRKIIENLLYGCESNDEHCVLHFNNIRSSFPKIDSIIHLLDIENKKAGLHGNNLSGGQRQVVNIINGLIQKASIIIIDEPTNALDPELKKEVILLLQTYKKHKKAIIVITHDKDLMAILDKQIKI
jgi:ABC-type bacteriocin/lantibiotic exporter with double-glycine peptidase domain